MAVTAHLLIAVVALQALLWLALFCAQTEIAEALDTPLEGLDDRHEGIRSARHALTRTVPLAVVAVISCVVLTRPALSVFAPGLTGDWVDPSDVVRGVFATSYVVGISLAAVLVHTTYGLSLRLGQLRSARW